MRYRYDPVKNWLRENPEKAPIGTIIDARGDGSYVYMSHRGILNLDSKADLEQAQKEDREFFNHHGQE